jgi:hypothetical protein
VRSTILFMVFACACDRPSDRAGPTSSPSSATASSAAAHASTASSAVATGSAAPNSSARSPAAGTWSGGYESKRAQVELPRGNPWPAWKKDDGARLGPGSVEVTVDDAGFVQGQVSGALGALRVRGRVEDGALRAGVTPVDPSEDGGMTGTITGTVKDAVIVATVRASSSTGQTVRVADVSLKRK